MSALPTSTELVNAHRYATGDDPAEIVKLLVGDTGLTNPWRLAWSSESVTAPTALRLDIGDPWDLVDTERVALVWDGEILDGLHSVEEGKSVVIDVKAVKGDRLELWSTDSMPITVTPISPTRAESERARIRSEAAKGGFEGFLDRMQQTQFAVLAVVALVAIVAGPKIVAALK